MTTETNNLSTINPPISCETPDAERIAGAKECVIALAKLEQSAENLPESANDGAVFAAIQSSDAEALVAQFGPLTQRQEGAFRTLAEYIHCLATTGTPYLEKWTPYVARTEQQIVEWAAAMNAQE
uniref:Uncharacterized protein n=1 Tax=Dechloromonas aromatica (strain RCB) TaxID=159087 RepID=Q47CJ8_DECAR